MKLNKLTANQVARARPWQAGELRKTGKKKGEPYEGGEPKRYGDGGGLHLVVEGPPESLKRKYVFRFTWYGKPAECGMGGYGTTLAEARAKAADARRKVRAGINPIEDKRADRARVATPTFGKCAIDLIAARRSEWRSRVHEGQWVTTLETFCAPIWGTPVDAIDTAAVLGVLTRIWQATPETASRLRGRIEAVLDAARARGFIGANEANPARWKGHLDHLLAKRGKLARGHHAAMPYENVPAFTAALREKETMPSLALQFLILTAARSGEVLGARWDEIDRDAKVWTVPAKRMKAGVVHRVPLSSAAMAILERMAGIRTGDLLFQGQRRGGQLSNSAVALLVPDGATVHGFRSAFRDWCGNETSFPREIAEGALAHRTGDSTEQAYRRGDALEKRRALMESWASFCGQAAGGNIVQIRSAG
jgi:integrase